MSLRFWLVLMVLVLFTRVYPAAGQARDTVVVGLLGEPDNIVPGFSNLAISSSISAILFIDLVGINPDWQPYPRLATDIPTLENGQWKLLPNGEMEIMFRLRPGFKWHDGTAVTAGDFVFGWEAQRNQSRKWRGQT
jgi:peptide/nickel transport system substrate-binding protein